MTLAASRKPEKRDGANPYVVELEKQLGHLARLEDPENMSPTAVVYREMLAAADAAGRPSWRGPGVDGGYCADPGTNSYAKGCRCPGCRAAAGS